MANNPEQKIVSWGREEAASKNRLDQQQDEATQEIRQRYQARIAQARGPKKAVLWVRMQVAMQRAGRQIEDKVAPRKGLYFQS